MPVTLSRRPGRRLAQQPLRLHYASFPVAQQRNGIRWLHHHPLLGSGGMGEVYLAQHPRLPRQDALKVLRTDVSDDGEFRERFSREADLAPSVSHPHIFTVHDKGEYDEQLWIATAFIDGTDAAQLMRDQYPAGMPLDGAVTIVTAIANALDYAHDRGLLHRDVKPANSLLSQPDKARRAWRRTRHASSWDPTPI